MPLPMDGYVVRVLLIPTIPAGSCIDCHGQAYVDISNNLDEDLLIQLALGSGRWSLRSSILRPNESTGCRGDQPRPTKVS